MSTRSTPAVVAHGADDLRVESVPLRTPGSDEAVVAVAYGGICGSDLHYWRHGAVGQSVLREPMVLGHEIVGIVAEAAPDGTGPSRGTAVAVHPATRECSDVRFPPDSPNLSPGVRYLGSAARVPHTDGGFARQVVLPVSMLRELPPGLDLRLAALAEPAAVAWHAVGRAGPLTGRRVLVVGSGPIGALAVAVARRAGASEVVATDLHETPLQIAHMVGATRTLSATDTDGIAEVDADVVIESSGTHRGLASAIAGATRGGTVVMVGLLPNGDQPVPVASAITRELRLLGSFRFNDEIDEVVAALADGTLAVGPVVTHVFGLDETLHAFAVAADTATSGKVLLDLRADQAAL
ncbi:zinc-binding dehydrogenase [Pseudonocardia phyllosphaerae]|uniref:zinc-binding dehydrogenase n=1 Tax=Pseudonocardia phyllosphaerae TaxID=3390502 RepID=UPI0039788AD7